MSQANLLLAAAEMGATVVGVERADGPSDFYEWNALVVRIDADTSLLAPETTEVCWRLLFEGGSYRSKAVAPCGDATPLDIVAPDQEAVPDDAVDRLRGILLSRALSEDLRTRIESEFAELNSRNVKIIVADGVYGIALDDGERCVLGRAGQHIEVREMNSDSREPNSCSPAVAVRLLAAEAADTAGVVGSG